jgi:hypothetical protein
VLSGPVPAQAVGRTGMILFIKWSATSGKLVRSMGGDGDVPVPDRARACRQMNVFYCATHGRSRTWNAKASADARSECK